jgi:penicillin-binding protein 2
MKVKNPFEIPASSQRGQKRQSLEWEESAMDSQTYVEGFHDTDRKTPPSVFLIFIMALVFVSLGVKLFHLQIVHGREYRNLSEGNRIRDQVVLAPRGLIKDRYGEVLAQNTASFNLVAVPFDLPKAGLDSEVVKLAALFGLDQADVMQKISKSKTDSFQPIVIKQDLSEQENILFETKANDFIGFDVQTNPIRDYPKADAFSHVLGYAGIISDSELLRFDSQGYAINDYIGKAGIEQSYEKYLRGVNGEEQVEVDATGKLVRVLGQDVPQSGNTLQLNLDKGLQEKLYTELIGKKAAAVAMDPKTGEVLAFVSVPGFNTNAFAHGIKKDQYQALLDNKDLPLFDRTLAGTYPPGSTVKPMVAAAALAEGTVSQNTVIYDNGLLTIPNQYNPSVSYNFYGWKHSGLGPMTVRSAIAESSDIYFYTVGGGHPASSIKGLGAQKLAEYYRKFNVGELTGIDLPGEKTGTVADPDWKASYFKNDSIMSKWYLGDTYHISIGQGDMLVTPLQVAEWTSIIANLGTGYKPHVAQKVIREDGAVVMEVHPEILVKDVVSPDVLRVVQEGMRQTVLAGTARALQSLPITSAGKTGTSQFDGADPSRTHAWFTAYAPYEDPQIVITVLVEAGGEGNAVAEPVVKDALQWWATNRYNK